MFVREWNVHVFVIFLADWNFIFRRRKCVIFENGKLQRMGSQTSEEKHVLRNMRDQVVTVRTVSSNLLRCRGVDNRWSIPPVVWCWGPRRWRMCSRSHGLQCGAASFDRSSNKWAEGGLTMNHSPARRRTVDTWAIWCCNEKQSIELNMCYLYWCTGWKDHILKTDRETLVKLKDDIWKKHITRSLWRDKYF